MGKSKVLRNSYYINNINFIFISLIKSSPNENDSSKENIILAPDYIEKFEKCNKILLDLEKKCNYI